MLETIAIILIVLWLLGVVSGYTLGNFIYVLWSWRSCCSWSASSAVDASSNDDRAVCRTRSCPRVFAGHDRRYRPYSVGRAGPFEGAVEWTDQLMGRKSSAKSSARPPSSEPPDRRRAVLDAAARRSAGPHRGDCGRLRVQPHASAMSQPPNPDRPPTRRGRMLPRRHRRFRSNHTNRRTCRRFRSRPTHHRGRRTLSGAAHRLRCGAS